MNYVMSKQIVNIIIFLVLLLSISCNAMERTVNGNAEPTGELEKPVVPEEISEVKIVLLGRDTYRAFVKSSFFGNTTKIRKDVEEQATLFCQEKLTRYRSIKWAETSTGYKLEFRFF